MRTSVIVKKLIRIMALGTVLLAAMGAMIFLVQMGREFGFKDVQCRQFPETRRFAEELRTLLYMLEDDAVFLKEYESAIPDEKISIANFRYENGNLSGYITQTVDYYYLLAHYEGGYSAYFDEYGIQLYSSNEYYDEWYEITLSAAEIQQANYFYAISREDYIELALDYAQLNSDGAYGINTMELVGDGAVTKYAVADGYIDEEFSPDSYIGFGNDFMYVYSPDEGMFYSSLYGWYTIPETLFFIGDDIQFYDNIELLRFQFASKEEILRQKIGADYLEYMRADLDLRYSQRNIAYYVQNEDAFYSNVESLDKLVSCNMYLCIVPTTSGEFAVEFHNFSNPYLSEEYVTGIMQNLNALRPKDKLYIGIYTTYPHYDVFSEANQCFTQYYPYTVPAFIIALIMLISAVALLIPVLRDCGRSSREDSTVRLIFPDKLPVEVMAAIVLFCFTVLIWDVYGVLHYNIDWFHSPYHIWRLFGRFILSYAFGITGLLSLIRRVKAGSLFGRSIIRWTVSLFKKIACAISRQKNLTARTIELFVLYWFLMSLGITVAFLAALSDSILFVCIGILLIIALNVRVLQLLIRQAKGEQSIREATSALAEGNLEYRPPVIKRLGTEQEIIDNIDHLSDGLQKVVEKSIYDERMKAELITNVSHDIKTPLTSIINYVGLMKQENIENEKVLHYIEVLDKKSQRLKQLTEDLVEVSRITSGNIELERVPIDFAELLRQSIGEFEDKFGERELQLVESISEHSQMIFADGRRTFRILENLFQNIYKYAMPKTRVYIDLTNEEERVILAVKNISMAPLNINAEELIERFVRGDQSRTTEGSGLGLSIARDLVGMQDGEFQIYLDGDLFKVVISFPEFISNEIIEMEETAEELEAEEQAALEKKD